MTKEQCIEMLPIMMAFAAGEIPIDTKTTRSKNETAPAILFMALNIALSPSLCDRESRCAQKVLENSIPIEVN